jgi:hypothetical protein
MSIRATGTASEFTFDFWPQRWCWHQPFHSLKEEVRAIKQMPWCCESQMGFADSTSAVAEPVVSLLALYNALEIFGLVSLCAVLLTAIFSSKVQRTATWFSFINAWIFSCLGHLVLLGQQTGPQPEFGLCLFQAAVIYAAAPL